MSRWELVLPLLLLAGCLGAAEEPAESSAPTEAEVPAFAPPAELGAPAITMGKAKMGQAVKLRVDVENAADPVDYLWHVVGPQGETVLVGQEVTYTPLTPTDHQVHVEVRDAYDRAVEASATMPVAIT